METNLKGKKTNTTLQHLHTPFVRPTPSNLLKDFNISFDSAPPFLLHGVAERLMIGFYLTKTVVEV